MITAYLWREWRLARPLFFSGVALLGMAGLAGAFDAPRGARYLAIHQDHLAGLGLIVSIVLLAGTTLVDGRCGSGGSFVARMPGAFWPTLRANILVTVAAIVLTTGIGAVLREALAAGFEMRSPMWTGSVTRDGLAWLCVAIVPWLMCAGGLVPRAFGILPIGYLLLAIVVVPAIVLQDTTSLPLYYWSDALGFGLWSATCGLVATTLVQRDRFRVRNPWWKAVGIAAIAAVPVFGVGMMRADDLARFDPFDPMTRVRVIRQTDETNVLYVRLVRRVPPARTELFQSGTVDLRTGEYTPMDDSVAPPPPNLIQRMAKDDGVVGLSRNYVGNAHLLGLTGRDKPQVAYFDITRGRTMTSPYSAAWPLRGDWVVDTKERGVACYRMFDPDSLTLRPVLGMNDGERIQCVLDRNRVIVHRPGKREMQALDPVTGVWTTLTFVGPVPDGRFRYADIVGRTPSGAFVLRIGFDRSVLYAKVDGDSLVCTTMLRSTEQVTGITESSLLASENGKVFRLTFGSSEKELVFPR